MWSLIHRTVKILSLSVTFATVPTDGSWISRSMPTITIHQLFRWPASTRPLTAGNVTRPSYFRRQKQPVSIVIPTCITLRLVPIAEDVILPIHGSLKISTKFISEAGFPLLALIIPPNVPNAIPPLHRCVLTRAAWSVTIAIRPTT